MSLRNTRKDVERPGTPVSLDELNNRLRAKRRAIRERLLVIPDRFAARLAAEKDEATIRSILSWEVRDALIDLSDALEP